MRNYVQPGEVITAAAPAGGILSGAGMMFGSLFGIAAYSAAPGLPVEISTMGVYDLPKKAGDTFTPGTKAYWDGTANNVTSTAAGNAKIGAVMLTAAGGDATARVRLDGVSI